MNSNTYARNKVYLFQIIYISKYKPLIIIILYDTAMLYNNLGVAHRPQSPFSKRNAIPHSKKNLKKPFISEDFWFLVGKIALGGEGSNQKRPLAFVLQKKTLTNTIIRYRENRRMQFTLRKSSQFTLNIWPQRK